MRLDSLATSRMVTTTKRVVVLPAPPTSPSPARRRRSLSTTLQLWLAVEAAIELIVVSDFISTDL